MKKFILTILISLIYLLGYSQIKCYIKINMSDCKNCFAAISYFDKINANVKKIFIFRGSYEQDREYIQQTFFNDTNQKAEILFSDSLYHSLDTFSASSIHVFTPQGLSAQFPFRAIDKNFHLINYPDTLYFRDKLPVSCKFKIENELLYTYNYPLSEIAIYNMNKWYANATKIKLTDKMIKIAYNKHFRDTSSYYKCNELREKMNVPRFIALNQIWSFDVKSDTLYFVSKHLYPKLCNYKGKADTCFYVFFSLFTVFNNSVLKITDIERTYKEDSLVYTYEGIGFLGTYFHFCNNKFLFNMGKKKLEKRNNYFIGEWVSNNGSISYNKPFPIDLPELTYKFKIGYLSEYTLHYPYLFSCFSAQLENLETFTSIYLPVNTGKLDYLYDSLPTITSPTKINYKVVDFCKSNNRIKLLFYRNKTLVVQEIDLTNKTTVGEKTLMTFSSDNVLRSDPQFEDFSTLVLLPMDGYYLVRLKI